MLVFVYGTLKRGFHANDMLGDAAQFRGAAALPGYKMHSLGWYPGIKATGDANDKVQGEVYEVQDTEMRHLDAYEGTPHLYKRETAKLEDGETEVQVYVYQHHVTEDSWIKSGEWTTK